MTWKPYDAVQVGESANAVDKNYDNNDTYMHASRYIGHVLRE